MILESLITDESKVTLDCCKALITRGGLIEISDEFWNNREVQGAIRGGYIRLVGNPPAQSVNVAGQPERKFRLRNCGVSAIALDCTKGRVGPAEIVEITEQQLNSREVQNAISWRLLEDVDNPPAPQEDMANNPAKLDELTSQDIEFASLLPEVQAKTATQTDIVPQRKQKRVPATRTKPKPIMASREDDLYRPSQVIDRQPTGRQVSEPANPIELDIGGGGSAKESNDDFSFGDIFNR